MPDRWKLTAALAILALGAGLAAQQLLPADAPSAQAPRDVDIVLCLDTSGSMEQLIDSARSRLWDVVNEVGEQEPNANLRVGLLSYGSPTPGTGASGYVVVQSALTNDLDALYATMWGLHTDGGDEYVGWVLEDALEKMPWSTSDNAARLIFVAGNESAYQGSKDPTRIAARAKVQGFKINTLYAGQVNQGVAENWDDVAEAGGGRFTAISMADGLVQVATPHDAEIERLNKALNDTYVPMGEAGRQRYRRVQEQDERAGRMGAASSAARALAKGSSVYKNEAWDLVDATTSGKAEPEAVSAPMLPPEMQAMRPAARRAYVETKKAERDAIKQQMAEIKEAREAWIEENAEESEGLGKKMKTIVAEQL
ncbi:MAG: vWA domain-containing protein [Myxococcota bacterium]